MAIPNAFVKMSGSLLQNEDVIEWLRKLSKEYFVVICIGGGKQINDAFIKNGFAIKFCPLGRVTASFDERQLARDILEKNRVVVEDLLHEKGINARVTIPVSDKAGVLCHTNGDVELLASYNGYDKLFLLTVKKRVNKKKSWLKKVAGIFEVIEKGKLDKIEVVGF